MQKLESGKSLERWIDDNHVVILDEFGAIWIGIPDPNDTCIEPEMIEPPRGYRFDEEDFEHFCKQVEKL